MTQKELSSALPSAVGGVDDVDSATARKPLEEAEATRKEVFQAELLKLVANSGLEKVVLAALNQQSAASTSKSLVDLQAKQKSEYPWSEEALAALFFDVGALSPMSPDELKEMMRDVPRLPACKHVQCIVAKWNDKHSLARVPKDRQDLVNKVSVEVQHLMLRVFKPLCAVLNEMYAMVNHLESVPVLSVAPDADEQSKAYAASMIQHKTGLAALLTLVEKTVRIQQDCLASAVEKYQKDEVFRHTTGTSASDLRTQQLKFTDSYDPMLQEIVKTAHKRQKHFASVSAPTSQPFQKGGFGNSGGRGSYRAVRNNKSFYRGRGRDGGRGGGGGGNFNVFKRYESGHSNNGYAAKGQFSFGGGRGSAPQGNERGGRGRGGRR